MTDALDRLHLPRPTIVKRADGSYGVAGLAGGGTVNVPAGRIPEPGKTIKWTPEGTMLAVGRMSRDGASLEAIRSWLEPDAGITRATLETFIDRCRLYLQQEIDAGREVEESNTTIAIPAELVGGEGDGTVPTGPVIFEPGEDDSLDGVGDLT